MESDILLTFVFFNVFFVGQVDHTQIDLTSSFVTILLLNPKQYGSFVLLRCCCCYNFWFEIFHLIYKDYFHASYYLLLWWKFPLILRMLVPTKMFLWSNTLKSFLNMSFYFWCLFIVFSYISYYFPDSFYAKKFWIAFCSFWIITWEILCVFKVLFSILVYWSF